MTAARPNRRQGSGTMAMLGAILLCASCAAPTVPASPENLTPATAPTSGDATVYSTRCAAPSRYLFGPNLAPDYSADTLFTISELSGDAIGGVLVRYNADTPQAGSDGQGSPSRIAEVLLDGSVRVLEEATVGSRTVLMENLYPLGANSQGGQYLFDRSNYGILLRSSEGEWSQVAILPEGSVFKAPSLALGIDGAIYIATASQVLRTVEGGDLEVIAGRAVRASDILFPQDPLPGLSLPVLDIALPSPTAIIVDDAGTIYISTADTVYSIADGALRIDYGIGSTAQLPEEASGAPNITGLALDVDGSLIVSDSANQLVYLINDGGTNLIASNTRFISDGVVLSRQDSAPLLTVDSNQEVVCAA